MKLSAILSIVGPVLLAVAFYVAYCGFGHIPADSVLHLWLKILPK